MASEAIPASSKYWDGKKIALTDNTLNNIEKKAFLLDAEALSAQQGYGAGLQGDDAVDAAKRAGITKDQLIQTEGTYSNLSAHAIEALQSNSSKDSRVKAVVALTELGYTNIYDDNTKNFMTPPESKDETPEPAPVEAPEHESSQNWKSNPYFNKGARTEARIESETKQGIAQARAISERNEQIRQEQEAARQMYEPEPEPAPKKFNYVQKNANFINTLMPNVGKKVVQQTEVRNIGRGPGQVTNPNLGRVGVRPPPTWMMAQQSRVQPQRQATQVPQRQMAQLPQRQTKQAAPQPVARRPLLNPAMAQRFQVGVGKRAVQPSYQAKPNVVNKFSMKKRK